MESYIIVANILVFLIISDSQLALLETFPATNDVEKPTSLCPCKDKLLCVPLTEAMKKNSTALPVLNYIKKSEKKEVW